MRHVVLCDALRPTKSMKESSTRKVLPECSKDESLKKKGGSSYPKSIPDSVGTMLQLGHL